MPEKYGDDRLIFNLSSEDDIELERLGDGFAGLARHFRRHLIDSGVDPEKAPSKLFVTDLRHGSVEFEVATAATLYVYALSAANGVVVWLDFYERVKNTLDYLAGRASRPENYNRDDARDYDAFLKTITGKRGASLRVRRAKFEQRTGKRETIAEFDFNENDVSHASLTLARDTSDIFQPEDPLLPRYHKTENGVPFIWHRTDREKGKASGQTSDRGIVAKVSDKPLPVYFASEIENQKDQMTKVKNNPFDLIYMVDVGVEYENDGTPRSYTILNIHKVVSSNN